MRLLSKCHVYFMAWWGRVPIHVDCSEFRCLYAITQVVGVRERGGRQGGRRAGGGAVEACEFVFPMLLTVATAKDLATKPSSGKDSNVQFPRMGRIGMRSAF